MVAGTYIGTLGDADAITQPDRGEIIEPGVFCQPASFTHQQTPGELDAKAGLDAATVANPGSENPKQPNTPWAAR
jgi:hypothetical protein